MDVELLARLQFALTIMFHYIYPPLSIGLGVALVIMQGAYLKTKDPLYRQMARFWTKIFALTFAVGVATGIVMEFEFGTNWATYSRFVGDVFGSALAAEGVFAFFLESGFLAILLFGWDRVGPKMHFFATLMVCLGAHFSAIWIVVANSWMHTPAGFEVVGDGVHARAVITNFWEMVFNPSSMTRLAHVIIGAWLAGAFLVISVSAYYLLKYRYINFSQRSLVVGLTIALVACILQAVTGDRSGEIIAEHQPAKLAAFEALYKTEDGAGMYLMGFPDPQNETVHLGIRIPKLLSFLAYKDINHQVIGLDRYPKKDWPNVPLVFQTFRIMIAMWVLMLGLTLIGLYQWKRGTLLTHKWTLRALVLSVLFPQIANQAGWMSTEVGRYPWIVQNLLRISEGLSKSVTSEQVLWSIIMFGIVYVFLFAMFLYLLNEKIKQGPESLQDEPVYHQLREVVKEAKESND
jgi:cytochrome d ubiquinol oxidase subunit I